MVFKYIIFYNYLIVVNENYVGIKIVDIKTEKIKAIDGKSKTLKGKMFEFRDNKKLEITEENEL